MPFLPSLSTVLWSKVMSFGPLPMTANQPFAVVLAIEYTVLTSCTRLFRMMMALVWPLGALSS